MAPASTFTNAEILTSMEGSRAGLTLGGDLVLASGRPYEVVSTVAKGGSSNICLVTMQVSDRYGKAVAGVYEFDWLLSDDTTAGAGLTATSASGAVAAGTAGTDLVAMVAKKATRVQTDATGKYILSITDTAKTAFVVVTHFALGFKKPTRIQAVLATADYD